MCLQMSGIDCVLQQSGTFGTFGRSGVAGLGFLPCCSCNTLFFFALAALVCGTAPAPQGPGARFLFRCLLLFFSSPALLLPLVLSPVAVVVLLLLTLVHLRPRHTLNKSQWTQNKASATPQQPQTLLRKETRSSALRSRARSKTCWWLSPVSSSARLCSSGAHT